MTIFSDNWEKSQDMALSFLLALSGAEVGKNKIMARYKGYAIGVCGPPPTPEPIAKGTWHEIYIDDLPTGIFFVLISNGVIEAQWCFTRCVECYYNLPGQTYPCLNLNDLGGQCYVDEELLLEIGFKYPIEEVTVEVIPPEYIHWGFPLESTWKPTEPDPYEWEGENDDVTCQIEAFRDSAVLGLSYKDCLSTLEDIKCCSPRPAYLESSGIDFYVVEEPPIEVIRLLFRLTLYIPHLAGSVPVDSEGIPIEFFCYFNDYSITIPGVENQIIITNYQTHFQHFIEQFNFVNAQKQKSLIQGYGGNITDQMTGGGNSINVFVQEKKGLFHIYVPPNEE